MAAPLSRARAGHGATDWNGTLVVVGGEVLGTGETLTSVEAYDPATDRWVEIAPLPVPLHGVAVAAVGDQLYALGGSRRAGAIANSGDALVLVP